MALKEKGRLLAIGAHTDDIELGAGGTIARALDAGWEVEYLIFSIARESVPKGFDPETLKYEAIEAAESMGIDRKQVTILDFPVRRFPAYRQEILDELVRRRQGFDVVLTHHSTDIHQDHAVIASESVRAFKAVPCLLGYDLPWNTVGEQSSNPNFFVTISEENLARKAAALSKFKTQAVAKRAYVSDEYLRSWARFRGVQAGVGLAEAFHMVRAIV